MTTLDADPEHPLGASWMNPCGRDTSPGASGPAHIRLSGTERTIGTVPSDQSPQRVLVVDDEPSIVDAVATTMRYEGFEVSEATTGRAALRAAAEWSPDLIVLDVMLPDLDGLGVVERLRRDGLRTPVLLLTARDAVGDRVAGLSAGADDYLVKPFSLSEVVARVRAILRRTDPAGSTPATRLTFADLVLDEASHEAWRGDRPLALSATQFALLRMFMRNPRRVLSKGQILEHVWHYDFGGDGSVVETYVSYLRKRLEPGPPLIHTIRMVGYVMREPEVDPRPG